MKTANITRIFRVLALSAFATALVVMSLPEQGFTKKKRKLPINSYISGAKIAYGKTVGDEGARPLDALFLLDSATMWYGMIPEVYFWETLIHSDLAQQVAESDTAARRERIVKLIGATDSLVMACDKENKKVKKKYKKKCKPFLITADSIRADWFTTYYNEAQDNRTTLVDNLPLIADETDPESKADLLAEQDTLLQLTLSGYDMASMLATADSLSLLVYQNLGNLFLELKDFGKSIPYFTKAAEMAKVSDPANYLNLLNQAAYASFQAEEYLEAARLWNEVIPEVDGEQKIDIYGNILAAFANLGIDDSLFYYNHKILAVDPNNAKALSMLGGKWFNRIQDLNKQSSDAREAGDDAKLAAIKKDLDAANDSAVVYLKRAFEVDSTDTQSIELYAITNMIRGARSESTDAWMRLTRLKPDDKTYWIYLADNYIALKQLKDAIEPYEKAVEIDDSDTEVWRNLVSLYQANNMTAKLKKAQAKLDALTKK